MAADGGAVAVARCTGVSRRAITAGCRELQQGRRGKAPSKGARIRRAGGGRKKDPRLLGALLALVEPATRGDPENPLRWTSKSVRHLADELKARGLCASHQLVSELLAGEGYSLQEIEHRLFSFISQNWRGKPLTSHEVIVQLIAATSNRKGLRVHAELDPASYPAGTKVSDEEMAKLRIELSAFHGEWNYSLRPKESH